MKTDIVELKTLFGKDACYTVPLFQRPYTWKREPNWTELFDDLRRAAENVERELNGGHAGGGYFLGAVVLAQMPNVITRLETRQVIDGQQRLTTLQVLLASIRGIADARGDERSERLIGKLCDNDPDLVPASDLTQQFKVWPSNPDRDAYRSALEGQVETGEVGLRAARGYFDAAIVDWLDAADVDHDPDTTAAGRLEALVTTVRDRVRLVVVDLEEHDDAQIIFETLNGRGTPLEAADLVKNLLFRSAEAQGRDVENLYDTYWRPFDEPSTWRREQRIGRAKRSRLDLFLGHWLTMVSGRDISPTTMYAEFDRWLTDSAMPVEGVFAELRRYGQIYDSFGARPYDSAEGQFFTRLAALDTTTVMPVLLHLYGLPDDRLSPAGRLRALQALDSFLIRRVLCGLTTKDYNNLFRDLGNAIRSRPSEAPDDVVVAELTRYDVDPRRWPADMDVFQGLRRPAYGRIQQGRLRVILEAIERHLRTGLTEQLAPVTDGTKLTIEHVLPQTWKTHWPLPAPGDPEAEAKRNQMLHWIGNLTLATSRMQPELSNGPWEKKRPALSEHSLLRLTTGSILRHPSEPTATTWADSWDEQHIELRTIYLAGLVWKIWPGPQTEQPAND